ncbi:MAG: tetratricopeptide repeat protein [Acidobacteriia bacterium]|nr:tetratricopeptide repeat protein [Terriglobia bacterium]
MLMYGASKEVQQLQASLAQLRKEMTQLKQSQDARMGEFEAVAQQALDASKRASTAVDSIQSADRQHLRFEENELVAPVVALATQMEEMSAALRAVQQAIAELTSPISRMQAEISEWKNTVRLAPAPLPLRTTSSTVAPGGAPGAQGVVRPAPNVELYNAAERDRAGGRWERALQEYTDYLKNYADSDLAGGAQFHVAFIHFSDGDYNSALREFGVILERYPNSGWTPDALYYEGMTLVKKGLQGQASAVFKELIERFPNHTLAKQAMVRTVPPAKQEDLNR